VRNELFQHRAKGSIEPRPPTSHTFSAARHVRRRGFTCSVRHAAVQRIETYLDHTDVQVPNSGRGVDSISLKITGAPGPRTIGVLGSGSIGLSARRRRL
jgi:hypothetical protein